MTINTNRNIDTESLITIRMLVSSTLHKQRRMLLLGLILDNNTNDTNITISMDINMHSGTSIHTNTNSHIHIDIGTNTIGHENIDTKISINNSTISNILTNAGELSLSYRPITQTVFRSKGNPWEGGENMYIYMHMLCLSTLKP